jgi:excisionase family DNA binding protein
MQHGKSHSGSASQPAGINWAPAALNTIKDTAAHLGCSTMHIYRLIAAGELRAVDIATPGAGRTKTRIRGDDLADYIDRKTRGRAS